VRAAPPLVVAFDFASARAAVAVAAGDELRAAIDGARSTGDGPEPLVLVERALAAASATVADVDGWIALAGPGSFTGLRIACATALGLSQATGRPAAGVDTLEALALAAPPGSGTVLAAVDALRGEWFVARFRRGPGLELAAEGAARLVPAAGVDLAGVDLVAGFGLDPLVAAARHSKSPPVRLEPANTVAEVARAASLGRWTWSSALLVRPRYLRAPATTAPK
jgi:tRNA threonylcarbamoyladenosine biosynthesis protein TsaB